MRHTTEYVQGDVEAVRALVREHPWATVVSFVPGRGLVSSHYPVLLEEDEDGIVLLSHVGRPDERLHELGQHEAMVIVYGPQGYVSPSWYDTSPAVPTWNFAVAHLYGVPELLSDEENLQVLDRLVAHFERVLPEPYLMNGTIANSEYAARIVHGTVGFRLRVTRFEAKEKMSQDKPAEVVERVVTALGEPGPYQNVPLAARMAALHGLDTGTAAPTTDDGTPAR
ncbi:negative transcriptional regulator, PaiB family [Plantibacter sp. VKM Ac-1784]|uniref:Negative transcriptional regulator, PaiB family n=1 Tax=Plantibacter elymi (nom. nud.) TaxID=199708 RepID=A0ABY1RIW4_9MICO|nr:MULTISPECIES: FMN-binding negative transcriptional regulator [Plantibacter]CAH0241323.1 Protease synthase and sporulation protein PAI 2 [Plantibacter cousiniae]SMQ75523.1 negative transcriptional regulator, PaiB family [Plantibacter sp. VKM Ac-1784]